MEPGKGCLNNLIYVINPIVIISLVCCYICPIGNYLTRIMFLVGYAKLYEIIGRVRVYGRRIYIYTIKI